ncbi:helix-turn-helix domain-containing protein [Synechococcus sp. CC9311]|uniref:helix-turn-helix domain-containing protein n=1 Tax=Synechococcus sp. (strain CC9311) TaxID=64471 RepID=UPI0000DDAEED|nr:helix-turn-helix domain-containing protein [Synechococcus sp. CC9311]ABI47622.1 Predicted HTH of cAMP family transcriptional regulator, putative [Synechococcus sp. CC9311]
MDLDESKTSKFINIEEGVVRISLISTINSELFPIGFFASEWLQLEKERLRDFSLRLEALNEVKFKISSSHDPTKKIESVFHSHWLLILCMIKSSNQVEIRICRLIAILVFSFGRRNKESYTLPFELSHSQIALLVGCTRSTVTRQLGLLKEKKLISSDKNNNRILVSEKLIIQESIFVDQLQFT